MRIPITWNDDSNHPLQFGSENECEVTNSNTMKAFGDLLSRSSSPSSSSLDSRDDKSDNYKGVRFNPTADEFILIPSLRTFTREEFENSWYGEMEFRSMKYEALETLRLNRMAGGFLEEDNDNDEYDDENSMSCLIKSSTIQNQQVENLDPNFQQQHSRNQLRKQQQFTMRGLECRTREGASYRKGVRRSLFDTFLQEQARQRREGIFDTESLGNISRNLSAESRYAAMTRGLEDEKVANSIASTTSRHSYSSHKTKMPLSLKTRNNGSCGKTRNSQMRNRSRLFRPVTHGANKSGLVNGHADTSLPSSNSILNQRRLNHICLNSTGKVTKKSEDLFLGLDLNLSSSPILPVITCQAAAISA